MRMGQPGGSRWQIAAGLSRIDTMDGRSERRDYRNRNDSRENRQSHMRTPPVAPVEIVVHDNTFPNTNQRNCVEPVPMQSSVGF
jgi:hypothetical protein